MCDCVLTVNFKSNLGKVAHKFFFYISNKYFSFQDKIITNGDVKYPTKDTNDKDTKPQGN